MPMKEYRRFAPGESSVSTFAYHEDRPRAPHLEQWNHKWRLETAASFVQFLIKMLEPDGKTSSVVDLGCGDGGLLSLVRRIPGVSSVFGVDFHPASADGWVERQVPAMPLNFIEHWDRVPFADIYTATEVLEHLEEPYDLLRKIRARNGAIVCSSPHDEGPGNIDASHNWAWDIEGYTRMLDSCGFDVLLSKADSRFQVHLAVGKPE
jgi:SAM-dependent methyltransferase